MGLDLKLGFIGTGVMSGAIARGVRASGNAKTQIFLYDADSAKAQVLAAETLGTTCKSSTELVESSDLVILGVKPGVQTAVLQQIAPALTEGCQPTLVSIAAGRTLESIATDLNVVTHLPPIVRVMPNVAAQVGQAMSAITATENTSEKALDAVKSVFESVGQVLELPESLFPVFTAMAGSSPAWMFYIVDSLAQAGVAGGLTKQQALQAATQAMLGSAVLLHEGASQGANPSELIDRVCSPGGTTVAGLLAAQEAGLAPSLHKAVAATVKRDAELG